MFRKPLKAEIWYPKSLQTHNTSEYDGKTCEKGDRQQTFDCSWEIWSPRGIDGSSNKEFHYYGGWTTNWPDSHNLEKKSKWHRSQVSIYREHDNVSHARLLHNLKVKDILVWITNFIKSFLEDRTTMIVLGSFKGDQISIETGIPQGSSLSSILFLCFASTLIPTLSIDSLSPIRFVDDTTILTWSSSMEENCQKLKNLHEKCLFWAQRHGAKLHQKNTSWSTFPELGRNTIW